MKWSTHEFEISEMGAVLGVGNISIWPQGGSQRGTWGAGAAVKEDGLFNFENVPPGKYFASGNPAAQYTKGSSTQPVEVKPGEITKIEVRK